MKQIALAMHAYHDENKHFPAAAIYDDQGRALLSWRVLLLPYLEEQVLFDQFHLNEAWDSPHNIQLLQKMPDVYRRPHGKKPEDKDSTIYQVFVGNGSMFEGREGKRLDDIVRASGASHTLMVAEAREPVFWTKPDDLHFDSDNPLPPLGGLFQGEFRPFSSEPQSNLFNAAFADGHVSRLPFRDEKLIRRLVMWQRTDPVQIP